MVNGNIMCVKSRYRKSGALLPGELSLIILFYLHSTEHLAASMVPLELW